jgi:hypothetical protein
MGERPQLALRECQEVRVWQRAKLRARRVPNRVKTWQNLVMIYGIE